MSAKSRIGFLCVSHPTKCSRGVMSNPTIQGIQDTVITRAWSYQVGSQVELGQSVFVVRIVQGLVYLVLLGSQQMHRVPPYDDPSVRYWPKQHPTLKHPN